MASLGVLKGGEFAAAEYRHSPPPTRLEMTTPQHHENKSRRDSRLRSFAERAGDLSSHNPLNSLPFFSPEYSPSNSNRNSFSKQRPPLPHVKSWSLSDVFTETVLPPPLELPRTAPRVDSPVASPDIEASYSSQKKLKDPLKNRVTSTVSPEARRLWNPNNCTPRNIANTVEQNHHHQEGDIVESRLGLGVNKRREFREISGRLPLLSIEERNQSRLSNSTTIVTSSSLQVEVGESSTFRASTASPITVRRPFEATRSTCQSPDGIVTTRTTIVNHHRQTSSRTITSNPVQSHLYAHSPSTPIRNPTPHPLFAVPVVGPTFRDKMADLESAVHAPPPTITQSVTTSSTPRGSIHSQTASAHSEAWGPRHPCFPHLNPHVPLNSPLYTTTRIIRIPRDWLIAGDLAPTFSLLYPSILSDSGLTETAFRALIAHLNAELQHIYSPWNWRNWIDATLGLVTGWVWDDLGLTGVKRRCENLERWIDRWNATLKEQGGVARVIGLKRTGYLCLDIQILRPWIGEVEAGNESEAREGSRRDEDVQGLEEKDRVVC